MKNACSQFLLLLLFLLSLSTSHPEPVKDSLNQFRRIYAYSLQKSRNDANRFCKSDDGGNSIIATARDTYDLESLTKICDKAYETSTSLDNFGKCFVRLRLKNGVWKWNKDRNNSLNIDTSSGGNCAAVYNNQLVRIACTRQLYFICENSSLVLVEKNKTWEEALDHCRALGENAGKPMDLLRLHDDEELSSAQEETAWAQTEEKWIGLRWLAGRWLWMNQTAGGKISLAECPASRAHCGTLSGTGQHARNCMEKKSFFCL